MKNYNSEEDPGRDWMLELQNGNAQAFDSIVVHYEHSVRLFILRYLRDKNRGEDLAQEAFIRVYKARNRYEPTAKFRTWLFTIVTRLCLNEIRGQKRQNQVFASQASTDEAQENLMGNVPDESIETPQDKVEREELQDVLQDAIDSLPEKQRIAILLLRQHECSYQEIASQMEASPQAVKSLLNRARENLRLKLSSYREGRLKNSSPSDPLPKETRHRPGEIPPQQANDQPGSGFLLGRNILPNLNSPLSGSPNTESK